MAKFSSFFVVLALVFSLVVVSSASARLVAVTGTESEESLKLSAAGPRIIQVGETGTMTVKVNGVESLNATTFLCVVGCGSGLQVETVSLVDYPSEWFNVRCLDQSTDSHTEVVVVIRSKRRWSGRVPFYSGTMFSITFRALEAGSYLIPVDNTKFNGIEYDLGLIEGWTQVTEENPNMIWGSDHIDFVETVSFYQSSDRIYWELGYHITGPLPLAFDVGQQIWAVYFDGERRLGASYGGRIYSTPNSYQLYISWNYFYASELDKFALEDASKVVFFNNIEEYNSYLANPYLKD